MASRASLLMLMLQASFLALVLFCCLQKASGLEASTTEDTASGTARAQPAASKSSFVRRQLVEKPQNGKGFGISGGQCLLNCTLTPPFPTCCVVGGIGTCVNTLQNPLHCGACNNVCQKGTICCSGRCVNNLFDRNNCLFCGRVCRFPATCAFGLCYYTY